MSWVATVFTFLLGIPLSIWTLACLLGLIDQRPKVVPLIRLTITLTLIALFLLATDRDLWQPLSWAFAVVLLTHTLGGFAFRHLALGVEGVDAEKKWPRRQGIGEGRGSQSPEHIEDEDDPSSPSL